MAQVAPPQATEAPAHVPEPFGLFSVVTPAPVGPGLRWENGLVWTDEQCGELPPVIVPNCASPVGIPLTFVQGQAQGAAQAFTVMGDFLCSPVAWSPEEAQAAATARLFNREEEHAAGYIVKLLTSDAVIHGSSLATTGNVPDDIALLEQTLAEDYGSLGVLLMSLQAVYALSTNHDLRQFGKGLNTPVGTPIVVVRTVAQHVTGFSAGIVPAPLLMRGEPFTSTNDLASAALLDRKQNDFYAAAFRTYVAGWTVGCGASYIALT
jgi:hypothetical protein